MTYPIAMRSPFVMQNNFSAVNVFRLFCLRKVQRQTLGDAATAVLHNDRTISRVWPAPYALNFKDRNMRSALCPTQGAS